MRHLTMVLAKTHFIQRSLIVLLVIVLLPFMGKAQGWQRLPSPAARDIGVGRDGSVWMIGNSDVGGGNHAIYKWDGTKFIMIPGVLGDAVRISIAPNGEPWVVNSAGKIFRRIGIGDDWQVFNMQAKDVAAGALGLAWIISTENVGGSDYAVYRMVPHNGGTMWERVPGVAGVGIVGGSFGPPLVINSTGKLFKLSGTSWSELPGITNIKDVAVENSFWITGITDEGGGNYGVYKWTSVKPQKSVGIAGIRIANDPKGNVYVVNMAGEIYQYIPPKPQPAPSVELWENVGKGGRYLAVNQSGNLDRPEGLEFSALKVNYNGWVIFYSKRDFSGSELRVKGPFELDNLIQVVKKNGPCIGGATVGPPGDWNDEIESVRIMTGDIDADGCGTNCPGPGYCGPPLSPLPLRSKAIGRWEELPDRTHRKATRVRRRIQPRVRVHKFQ